MKRVLLTGATGFVGKHLTERLLSQKTFEVLATYRTEQATFPEGVLAEKVNLLDQASVDAMIEKHKPDAVIHLAGMASAGQSFGAPAETFTTNILGQLHLLESLRKFNLLTTKVLIVSTAEVYGEVKPEDLPIDELTPFNPVNPYAVSKLTQDYLGLQYKLAYDMDIVRVRPFNHIGPGQKDTFVVASFAKQIAEIEKGKKEPVLYVGNLEAKRDFSDVRDIVAAYQILLEKGEKGEVYNLGSGVSRKISEILDTLLSFSKTHIDVTTDPERFRPVDAPEIVCDYTKFNRLTGWKPEISFEKTLQDILDYWRDIV